MYTNQDTFRDAMQQDVDVKKCKYFAKSLDRFFTQFANDLYYDLLLLVVQELFLLYVNVKCNICI